MDRIGEWREEQRAQVIELLSTGTPENINRARSLASSAVCLGILQEQISSVEILKDFLELDDESI